LISKFEKAFGKIRKKEKASKETLKIYSFRKPKREVGPSEKVDHISIFDFKEEK
jgi:hypothetical protein